MEFNYPNSNSTFYSPANALVDLNNNCYYNNSTNNVYGMNSLEISPGIIPPLDYNYTYIPQQQQHYKHQPQLAAGIAAIATDYQYTPRDVLYNYQRNRYMPYTRSINTVTTTRYQHALTPYVPPLPPPQPIYQTCPSAWMPSFNSVKTASSVVVQQQQQQHSVIQLSNMQNGGSLNSSLIMDNSYLLGNADKHNSMLNASTISTSLNSLNNKGINTVTTTTTTTTTTTAESKVSTGTSSNTCNNNSNSNSNSIANLLVTNDTITLQITNLDYTMDETSLRNYLMNQLKPITPVVSLTFDGNSFAKVTVPDLYFAKKVVSNLHRKKMGHKRILVSYTRDSSLTEFKTLRCQVAGLLKDVPSYTLPMYKFRELFQSRFKTSISVLDLYKMHDICTITVDDNEDKFISLHEELMNTLETSPLVEGLQHSVPYCTVHFKREQHKGWAEQDIEPLPAVFMTIKQIQKIIQPLVKTHIGDIPVATLVHCIEGELNVQITPNENGVNLEHLICCVQGIQIDVNNFGIKILSCMDNNNNGNNFKENNNNDPLYQISREIIELVKMSPKATMKFSRFIPAYHNHFGKQCRVADYGYTKLIELFEALSTVVQIMGDGENRQITLTHRTQIRRFTSDLLRVLRANGNRSILLSELPLIFTQTQNRNFDVTDYGVCDITDILDGLANSNIVIITPTHKGKDFLISMPKRKQTAIELEMLSFFAGEVVELFSTAPQYTILFQKFGRSYQYHFGVQCRLSDYGFLKLADLIDAIQGVVEMEVTNDEDKKIYLSKQMARRIFAKQCEELISENFGCPMTCVKVSEVLSMHKKKFGYQIQAHTLGAADFEQAVALLPYVELIKKDDELWIICHNQDRKFRKLSYRASKYLLAYEVTKPEEKHVNMDKTPPVSSLLTLNDFLEGFNKRYNANLTEVTIRAMKHAVEIITENGCHYVCLSGFIKLLMKIIRLLEQHTAMNLNEIKNGLNCTLSTTFEYGFPNILSIITDYTDLFSINLIKTQERAVVTLNKDTEMRLHYYGHHKPLFGSLKMPCSKQKTLRSNRAPLGEYNVRNGSNMPGPPPLKTRALSNEMNSLTSLHHHHTTTNQNVQSTTKDMVYVTASSRYSNGNGKSVNCNGSVINNSHSSASCTITNPNYPKIKDNKENSMNSSFLLNNSFNTSNQSLSSSSSMYADLNNSAEANKTNLLFLQPPPPPTNTPPPTPSASASASATATATVSLNHQQFQQPQPQPSNITTQPPVKSASYAMNKIMPSQYPYSGYPTNNINRTNNTKLWDRRQNLFYHQKQQQGTYLNRSAAATVNISNSKSTNSFSSSSSTMKPSTGYNELVNNMYMYPMYEPPKPDMPRSDNMPFWIDPIWTNSNGCSGEKPNNELLNIPLPECRSLNVVPAVMSPYTLSKIENMKHVFNFDSADRKIA